MPNWCENRATISGPEPVITEIKGILAQEEPSLLSWMVPEPQYEGDQDWYGWRIGNWGTKWDISGVYIDNDSEQDSITFSFSTAWGPCVEAFHNWAVNDGRVQFTLEYWEPGMGFAGRVDYDGEYLADDHRDSQDDRAGYLQLAEEVFGYVEDDEPEPLTEWYKQGIIEKDLK
jgi:hypothetical protein